MPNLNEEKLLYEYDIDNYINNLKEGIDLLSIEEINTVIERILSAYTRNGSVYIFGNGGSAATASHFVTDFNKGLCENISKKFRFHCLNDNISSIMAIANDISFDEVFKEQLKNYLSQDDLVIAISGSGNSINAVKGLEFAKMNGVETIGLVGYNGGRIKEIADYSIHVRVNDMQKVEDMHLMLAHLMMTTINKHFQKNGDVKVFSDIAIGVDANGN